MFKAISLASSASVIFLIVKFVCIRTLEHIKNMFGHLTLNCLPLNVTVVKKPFGV